MSKLAIALLLFSLKVPLLLATGPVSPIVTLWDNQRISLRGCAIWLASIWSEPHLGPKFPPGKYSPQASIGRYKLYLSDRNPELGTSVEVASQNLEALDRMVKNVTDRSMTHREAQIFLKKAEKIKERTKSNEKLDQGDFIEAATLFSLAVDSTATAIPPGPSPDGTKIRLGKLLERNDTLFEVTTDDLSIFELNDLSPYGIFPVQVVASTTNGDGRKMPSKTWLLHELRHWTGINNLIADHTYREFELSDLPKREALYARFKKLSHEQSPEVNAMLASIYFGVTHEIDPKLTTPKRLKTILQAFYTEFGDLDQVRSVAWERANRVSNLAISENQSKSAVKLFEEFVNSEINLWK